MFKGQFFKANSNFTIFEILPVIMMNQMYLENNMVMDKVRELIIFYYLHMIHVYRSIFQGKPKFCYSGNTSSHFEGPSVFREWSPNP